MTAVTRRSWLGRHPGLAAIAATVAVYVGSWFSAWVLSLAAMAAALSIAVTPAMALAHAAGLTGLNRAWWTPLARAWADREPRTFPRASPRWLLISGIAALTPWMAAMAAVVFLDIKLDRWDPNDYVEPIHPLAILIALVPPSTLVAAGAAIWWPGRRTRWLRAYPLVVWLPVAVAAAAGWISPPLAFVLGADGPFAVIDAFFVFALALWSGAVLFASPARLEPHPGQENGLLFAHGPTPPIPPAPPGP